MMMCFGTKDFLMPKCGGKADPRDLNGDGIPNPRDTPPQKSMMEGGRKRT